MKLGNKIYSVAASLLLLAVMLCFAATTVEAQDMMQINCKVRFINKADHNKEFTEPVLYKLYANMAIANEVKNRFDKIFESEGDNLYDKLDRIKNKENISRLTPGDGVIMTNVRPGMAVLVIAETDGKTSTFEVKAGVIEYPDIVFEVQRKVGATKTGVYKDDGDVVTIIKPDRAVFKVRFPVNKELIKKSSRLILQTYVIDCMTDDTVAYCKPIVYEESEYHGLQDKRMDFDFYKNDKLSSGYKVGGIPLIVDTTFVYMKDKNKLDATYKGPTKFVIEDYHHVYYTDTIGNSCLVHTPFKFLDFSAATPDIELTSEFYDMAEDVLDDVQADLHLRFVNNTDEVAKDSLNEVERIKITEELKSYGRELVSPAIVGTASPEGGEKRNRELAYKRARKVREFISKYLPSRTQLSVKEYVYTWDDVVEELTKRRLLDEAQIVRNVVSSNNVRDVFGIVKNLPIYKTSVEPILENMRSIKCTYSYVKQHVMSQDEVVRAYYKNKKEYLAGTKRLSSGDYYNLYLALANDTIELDTVTIMAYNWLKSMPESRVYGQKIAPFVYCRMARLLQSYGTPDTLLLAPFLNDSVRGVNIPSNKNGIIVKMNRPDILVAQALNYYQLCDYGKAQWYINKLKRSGKTVPGLDKLEKFMTFQRYLGEDEKNDDFREAKRYVLNSNADNRAILYTEMPGWRPGKTEEEKFKNVDDLINRMDDSNPKKWYLKGILWVSKAGNEPDLSAYAVAEQSDVLGRTTEQKKKIPYYLAYFHHSFQLEPTYKRYYYTEKHVDEKKRRQNKYLKENFANYEEIFKMLQRRDAARRKELMQNDDENVNNKNMEEDNVSVGNDGTTHSPATGSTSVSETADDKTGYVTPQQ